MVEQIKPLGPQGPRWQDGRRFMSLYNYFRFGSLQRPMTSTSSSSRFGFVAFAETWNGRLARLGFVIGLGSEWLTGQGILARIGLG